MSNKIFRGYLQDLLQQIFEQIQESLSAELIVSQELIGKKEALLNIHFPTSPEMLEKAQYRLKFEELFFIQLQLVRKKLIRKNKIKGYVFAKVGDALEIKRKDLANTFVKTMSVEPEESDDSEV